MADGIDNAPIVFVVVHIFLLVDEEVVNLLVAEGLHIVEARLLQIPEVASVVKLFFLCLYPKDEKNRSATLFTCELDSQRSYLSAAHLLSLFRRNFSRHFYLQRKR